MQSNKADKDVLCADFIKEKLIYDLAPVVYDEVDSTNLELKRRVQRGDESSRLVVANKQTKGRGRLGRTFESPGETGIYFSLLLPGISMERILLITSAAAVGVCRGIRKVTEAQPGIKWVNDIYIGGRKVCGILGESVVCDVNDPESNLKLNVVLGIGINVTKDRAAFSKEVNDVAGALFEDKEAQQASRNEIVASVVNEFMSIYNNLPDRAYLDDYRKWSVVIGRSVNYLENNIWHTGEAIDIDENGGLLVKENGEIKVLSTGEITLRVKN